MTSHLWDVRGWEMKSVAGPGPLVAGSHTASPGSLSVFAHGLSFSSLCLSPSRPCLCFWPSHRSLQQSPLHRSPQVGAGARRSHLRHHHLGYCLSPELGCQPPHHACCLALRGRVHAPGLAPALSLSSRVGPSCMPGAILPQTPVCSIVRVAGGLGDSWSFCPLPTDRLQGQWGQPA